MNGLLLDRLQQSGQLKAGKYDLDFDHEFIPTEKYDAKYSHKKERGYFSGIATIGEMLVAIENRNANTNVRFHQKETLANIFERLARRGLFIDRCRMDCGSFSEETIRMVHGYCSKFYIRASRCQTLYERMSEVTSIPFVSFLQEEGYRLVIQRKRRDKEEQGDLFEGEYTYRCFVTNDHESTEKDVILFYNQRGVSERVFDRMNNDFGWKPLPYSFMKENTVFLLLTAMAANFFSYIARKVAKVFKEVSQVSRTKRFIFRFITMPAK